MIMWMKSDRELKKKQFLINSGFWMFDFAETVFEVRNRKNSVYTQNVFFYFWAEDDSSNKGEISKNGFWP